MTIEKESTYLSQTNPKLFFYFDHKIAQTKMFARLNCTAYIYVTIDAKKLAEITDNGKLNLNNKTYLPKKKINTSQSDHHPLNINLKKNTSIQIITGILLENCDSENVNFNVRREPSRS